MLSSAWLVRRPLPRCKRLDAHCAAALRPPLSARTPLLPLHSTVSSPFSTASTPPPTSPYRPPTAFFFRAPTTPHAIPPTPFSFAALYRFPPHYQAEEDPAYLGKPFQFLLKLAQPLSPPLPTASSPPLGLDSSPLHQSSAPYHVHELLFFADLTVLELERALLPHFHTLAALQLQQANRALPHTTSVQQLYNSQPALTPLPLA